MSAELGLPPAMLGEIQTAYENPPRAYHSWNHVLDVLHWNEIVGQEVGWEHPREILLATLCHDAVYVPGAKDNEAQSAEFAVDVIKRHLGDGSVDTELVSRLIRLTARHGVLTPADVDAESALFLDCDMAILGSPREEFIRYDAAIREEYGFVAEEDYNAGRQAFLEQVLDSPRIFLSSHFGAKLEFAARENLQAALERLREPDHR